MVAKLGLGTTLLTLARRFCDNTNGCLPSIPVSSAEGARVPLEFYLFSLPLSTFCAWADVVGDRTMTANTACCDAGCSTMGPGGTWVSVMLLLRVC